MKTATDIKKVSSFKLKIEIQSRTDTGEQIVSELVDCSLQEMEDELRRRHPKNGAFIKIDLTEKITDVMVEGKTERIAFLIIRMLAQNEELRNIFEAALMTIKSVPEEMLDCITERKN